MSWVGKMDDCMDEEIMNFNLAVTDHSVTINRLQIESRNGS
jgi:hypothetical protein